MFKQSKVSLFLILMVFFIGYTDTASDSKHDTLSDSTQNLKEEEYPAVNAGEEKKHAQDSIQSEKLTKKQKREQKRKKRRADKEMSISAHKSMLLGTIKHKHGFTGKKRYKGEGPLKPQTFCPVMGGPIDKNAYTNYKGMRIYFCCEGCIYQFKRTPNMYIKTLKRYGEKPEKLE